jgi:transposase
MVVHIATPHKRAINAFEKLIAGDVADGLKANEIARKRNISIVMVIDTVSRIRAKGYDFSK